MKVFSGGWSFRAILLLLSVSAAVGNDLVSGSTSRLPMSLSSVINDLEAEGASEIAAATFLSSRGVTRASRASILQSLFPSSSSSSSSSGESSGDGEDSVVDGLTTAFGLKLASQKKGVAIANPSVDASVTEVAATVHACGGCVVFVVSQQDLQRGEGLFDKLGPALEDLLRTDTDSTKRGLIVVVEGDIADTQIAKSKLESAASVMLENLVQTSTKHKANSISDVFHGNVKYVVSSSTKNLEEALCEMTACTEPSVAQSTVASAVYQSINSGYTSVGTLQKSPHDLAAVRKLLPASRAALQSCISTVSSKVGANSDDAEDAATLIADFGELCDAAVKRSLEQFDTYADQMMKKSTVAKRIRHDLVQEMYAELDDFYQTQMNLLQKASFESFQRGLSKLRLSPNLKTDMQRVASDVVKQFKSASRKMTFKNNASSNTSNDLARCGQLKRQLADYIQLRLQAARADGKYRPLPRKGVTIGMHWLLPKPFGNDYRQEPWKVHTMDDLVYTPQDKLTDVNPQDVQAAAAAEGNVKAPADWTKYIVPAPTSSEMLYMK